MKASWILLKGESTSKQPKIQPILFYLKQSVLFMLQQEKPR